MQGCDNTPELRARMRPSPNLDPRKKQVHDFRNSLTELFLALETGDERLITFCAEELTNLYMRAVMGTKP